MTRKGPGRPRLAPQERRSDSMTTNVTVAERRKIQAWAKAHGLTTSEYIRMKALQDPIERIS